MWILTFCLPDAALSSTFTGCCLDNESEVVLPLMNEWILIPAQPETHKHPLNFVVLSAEAPFFFLHCTVRWNFLQTSEGQLLLKFSFTAAGYSLKSTSFFFFFAISQSLCWWFARLANVFFFLQFWTQDGPLPAGCFLPASHLPAGPETMLLGFQGRPGPRPFGCLQLPGGRRQRLVSMATFKQNYIQVSHQNLNASGFISFAHSDSELTQSGKRSEVSRGAPRTEVFLHTSLWRDSVAAISRFDQLGHTGGLLFSNN